MKERNEAVLQELEGWNRLQEERELDEEETVFKKNNKALLWNCLRLEELEWRQMSRALWLREQHGVFWPLTTLDLWSLMGGE